jgi:ligand-binding sensor domain-containing protein
MRIALPALIRHRLSYMVLIALCLTAATGQAQRKSIKQYVHKIWTTDNGLPQNSAGILQSRDGYIWFATQEGLARFDGVEFRVFDRRNTKELPASWYVRMKEDSAGALWLRPIGFAPGMVRYHDGMFTRLDTSNALPHNRTVTWEIDKYGTMWIGTLGGLFESKDGKYRTYTVKDGLPGDTVFGLGMDSKKNLWISTSGGLARLVAGKIERMTGQKDFPDTTFLRLNGSANCFEDRHGTLWMSTPTHLLAYAGGAVTRYDKKSVLSNPVIQAVHEDSEGILWFAPEANSLPRTIRI